MDGKVFLTEQEYDDQMWQLDSLWKCPICDRQAEWIDEIFDEELSQ